MAVRTFTRDEVAKHNKDGDLWVVIDAVVYDLSKFAKFHPGGVGVLLDEDVAGKDATTVFFGLHRSSVLGKYQNLRVGTIGGEKEQIRLKVSGDMSRVPYAESMWLRPSFKSPYFNDSHRRLQAAVRQWTDEVLLPDALRCEENGKGASRTVLDQMAELKINHMRLGPGKHLHGLTLMGGVKGEEYDYFHEMIVTQEFQRVMCHGYLTGTNSGVFLGLPPVANFAAEPMRSQIMDEVLNSKKAICLAITEAFAGSDVAGLRTRATLSADGKSWVLNGTKKWISAGMFSDYFLLAAKTYGGSVRDGSVSCFLVPRVEGLSTKPITTSYSAAAGTSFVTLENVTIPVENLVGEQGRGLYMIFSNFNHERWYMACAVASRLRTLVEECLLWAAQRNVFGKPLLSQPVIRAKLADMIARAEASQAWLEAITFQMCNMQYDQQAKALAGPIAFLKMQLTRNIAEATDDAVQIFGGRALTKTGMGRVIEHAQRTRKFDAVLGGAEEVMGDLGVRQLMRSLPADQRL